MKFEKSVVEVIKERRSVRSYLPITLDAAIRNSIQDYIETLRGPFNAGIRLRMVEESSIVEESGGKIGTYGIIKGANTYIAAIMKTDREHGLEDIGYMLEELILYSTSIGLGTCWLGGTFNRGQFAKSLSLTEGETLPIVTPIGYPREKMSLMERAVRFAAGSNNRKPWGELFFNKGFSTPMTKENAGNYAALLEMVRLAPSASNKQPWRLVRDNNQWHFYLKASKGYGEGLGFDIQRVDIGIAMCHFQLAAEELNIKGKWQNILPKDIAALGDTKYIITWVEE